MKVKEKLLYLSSITEYGTCIYFGVYILFRLPKNEGNTNCSRMTSSVPIFSLLLTKYRLIKKKRIAAISGEPVKVETRKRYRSKALSFIYLHAKCHPPCCKTKKVIDRERRCGETQLIFLSLVMFHSGVHF